MAVVMVMADILAMVEAGAVMEEVGASLVWVGEAVASVEAGAAMVV
jgi:hypothetical protein